VRRYAQLAGTALCSFLLVRSLFAALSLMTSTNSVSIPFATTDYDPSTGVAQVTRTSAQTLTIISDKKTWTLSVRAMTSTFSFIPSLSDPNPNKPAADLAVRDPATSSSFVALTASDQVLSAGPKSATPQTVNLDYRLNSNLSSNPPGNYTISIIYTLTNP
jgi:hypothetical protein